MAAATLLTDAFTEAIAYWRANNGGTRAGLIADLQAVLGITQATAAKWVDAMTQQAYDQAMTDTPDYPGFKTRLLAVGPARALAGAQCVFESLRSTLLLQDATNEELAKIDLVLAAIDADIIACDTAIAAVTAEPASTARDLSLLALSDYRLKLQRRRTARELDRNRLLGT